MKVIQNYVAPSTEDLARLKEELGYTGTQMADLAGLAGANQWRKYTGGASPRELGPQMLFYLAARLVLDDAETGRILARMHHIGADFGYDEAGPQGYREG